MQKRKEKLAAMQTAAELDEAVRQGLKYEKKEKNRRVTRSL